MNEELIYKLLDLANKWQSVIVWSDAERDYQMCMGQQKRDGQALEKLLKEYGFCPPKRELTK